MTNDTDRAINLVKELQEYLPKNDKKGQRILEKLEESIDFLQTTKPCTECEATGKCECPECSGSGEIECMECEGLGRVDGNAI